MSSIADAGSGDDPDAADVVADAGDGGAADATPRVDAPPGSPTLTVTLAGDGAGTVTSDPVGIDCGSSCESSFASGTAVTLTASAAAAGRFAGWSGGGCSGTGDCEVNLTDDTTVTATFDASGEVVWADRYGSGDSEEIFDMEVDSSGNVIFVGSLRGNASIGGEAVTAQDSADGVAAKFDPDGDLIWLTRIPGDGGEFIHRVAVDSSGDVFVAGYFNGDITLVDTVHVSAGGDDAFVAKLSGATGEMAWGNAFGGQAVDQVDSLAVANDGDAFVGFHFKGTSNFGDNDVTAAGGDDIVIARYSGLNGSHVRSDRYGGQTGDDQTRAMVVDPDGNLYVAGYFVGSIDLGGGTLSAFAGSRDAFLVKYNDAGTEQWSDRYGGDGRDTGREVALDADGDVFMAAVFNDTATFGSGNFSSIGDADLALAKYDGATGGHRWSKAFAVSDVFKGTGDLAIDAGNPIVTGFFNGDIDFGGGTIGTVGRRDFYAVEFSGSDGAYHWATSFAESDSGAFGRTAVVSPSGDALYLGGRFNGTVNFGDTPLSSAGGEDAVFLRLVP